VTPASSVVAAIRSLPYHNCTLAMLHRWGCKCHCQHHLRGNQERTKVVAVDLFSTAVWGAAAAATVEG